MPRFVLYKLRCSRMVHSDRDTRMFGSRLRRPVKSERRYVEYVTPVVDASG